MILTTYSEHLLVTLYLQKLVMMVDLAYVSVGSPYNLGHKELLGKNL